MATTNQTSRTLATIGVIIMLFSGFGVTGCTKAKAEKVDPDFSTTIPLDRFVVNLKDPKVKQYLKVKMALEITKEAYAAELTARLPQLRDTILLHLSSKPMSDITTIDGKVRLRRELLAKINRILKNGKVRNLYFTQFVIQ